MTTQNFDTQNSRGMIQKETQSFFSLEDLYQIELFLRIYGFLMV